MNFDLLIKLTPSEYQRLAFWGLFALKQTIEDQACLWLISNEQLAIAQFAQAKFSHLKSIAWLSRKHDRAYAVRLPIHFGRCLYEYMSDSDLRGADVSLFGKLDQALVNLRAIEPQRPTSQPDFHP